MLMVMSSCVLYCREHPDEDDEFDPRLDHEIEVGFPPPMGALYLCHILISLSCSMV